MGPPHRFGLSLSAGLGAGSDAQSRTDLHRSVGSGAGSAGLPPLEEAHPAMPEEKISGSSSFLADRVRSGGLGKSYRGRSRHFGGSHRRHYSGRSSHHRFKMTDIQTVSNLSGDPDKLRCKMTWAYTSAFTLAGGNVAFANTKLNSIYAVGSGGNSVAKYAVMYGRYARSWVRASSIYFRCWADDSASNPEPFRIMVVPVTSSANTTYGAYTNLNSFEAVPHAKHAMYSPGAEIPTVKHYFSPTALYMGSEAISMSTDVRWSGTTGVDPTTLAYWLIGLQNVAGTTSTNVQYEIVMDYYVEWTSVLPVPVLALSDRFGNDTSATEDADEDHQLSWSSVGKRKDRDGDVSMLPQTFKRLKVDTVTPAVGAGAGSAAGSGPTPAQSPSSAAGIYCRVFLLLLSPFLLFLVR